MKTDDQLDTAFYITGWILLAVLAILAVGAHLFNKDLLHSFPPCAIHAVTGYYCPGCGATRALIALLRGQLVRSLMYHPFILYVTAGGGWFMLSQTVERLSGRRIRVGLHFRYIYVWIGLALIFGNMFIRNVMVYKGV